MADKTERPSPGGSSVLARVMAPPALLAVSAVFGTVLLILVCLIPQNALYKNTLASARLLYSEGTYPQLTPLFGGVVLDNYTDGLMVNTAYTSCGSAVRDALLATRTYYTKRERDPMLDLYAWLTMGYASKAEDSTYRQAFYGRYWHGYLVYLRPLLVLLPLSGIRTLNMVLQLCLMGLLFFSLIRKKKPELAVPVLVMWICLSPFSLFYSLQFSAVYYQTVLLCLILIRRHGRLTSLPRCLLFELGGILTAYFDLLTYPVVSLGVPLILYLSLDYARPLSLKARLSEVISSCLFWAAGYGGMWGLKWVIAGLFTDQDVIAGALRQAAFRISHSYNQVSFTWPGVIAENAAELLSAPAVAAVLLSAAAAAVILLFFKLSGRGLLPLNAPAALAIGLVSLLPFAWYLVLMNHSAIHCFMTFRDLVVFIYAVLSLLYVRFGRPGQP